MIKNKKRSDRFISKGKIQRSKKELRNLVTCTVMSVALVTLLCGCGSGIEDEMGLARNYYPNLKACVEDYSPADCVLAKMFKDDVIGKASLTDDARVLSTARGYLGPWYFWHPYLYTNKDLQRVVISQKEVKLEEPDPITGSTSRMVDDRVFDNKGPGRTAEAPGADLDSKVVRKVMANTPDIPPSLLFAGAVGTTNMVAATKKALIDDASSVGGNSRYRTTYMPGFNGYYPWYFGRPTYVSQKASRIVLPSGRMIRPGEFVSFRTSILGDPSRGPEVMASMVRTAVRDGHTYVKFGAKCPPPVPPRYSPSWRNF